MSSRQKWVCCLVSGGLLLIYFAAPSGWRSGDRAQLLASAHATERENKAPTGSREKLRELLEERYEILKTFVETQKRLMEVGQSSAGKLAGATAALLRAEADLRSTHSERIEIHEKIVTIMRECEELIAREANAGMAGQDDVAKTKLARLKAQIKLEKMKLSQQASR